MNARIEKKLNDKYNKKTDYETNGIFKKTYDFFLIPILNSLSPKLQNTIKKTHRSAKEVIEHKTSHRALEALYNYGICPGNTNFKEKIFQKIWFNTNNSRAVRNRLKMVKREISSFAQDTINEGKTLNIFSIASGSARAIIESISNIYIPEDRKVYISFLDKNPNAIEYSKGKVSELGFDKNFIFNWCIDTASNFYKHLKNGKPNIVEMVGLLDYFDDEKALSIFKTIFDQLDNGGIFITANIDNNAERKFVTNFIGWDMIYRNDKDLFRLATQAGFKKENIKILYEPLKIHVVLVAKK